MFHTKSVTRSSDKKPNYASLLPEQEKCLRETPGNGRALRGRDTEGAMEIHTRFKTFMRSPVHRICGDEFVAILKKGL